MHASVCKQLISYDFFVFPLYLQTPHIVPIVNHMQHMHNYIHSIVRHTHVRTHRTHTNDTSACTYHLTYLSCMHTDSHTHTDTSASYHKPIKTCTYRPPDIIEYKTNCLNVHRDYVTKLVYGWQL